MNEEKHDSRAPSEKMIKGLNQQEQVTALYTAVMAQCRMTSDRCTTERPGKSFQLQRNQRSGTRAKPARSGPGRPQTVSARQQRHESANESGEQYIWQPMHAAKRNAVSAGPGCHHMPGIRENGARYVMGHILSAGFSRKLSTVGTSLLRKICLSLLDMVWYYQKIDIPMTRFAKTGSLFCYRNPTFLKRTKYCFVTVKISW